MPGTIWSVFFELLNKLLHKYHGGGGILIGLSPNIQMRKLKHREVK